MGISHSSCGNSASRFVWLLVVPSIFAVVDPAQAQTTKPRTAADELVDASNSFGFSFYQKLAAEPASAGKNLLFSPYSISTGFSMLMEGAGGETRNQLAQALHLQATDSSTLHDGARSLRKKLVESTAKEGFQLYSANGIWVDDSFSPKPQFIQMLQQVYGTQGPAKVSFKTDPQAARQAINNWGDQQTNGKIKQIIPGGLPPETEMVLANTVYLKATWFKPFEKSKTTVKPFHVDHDPAHDVSAPTMAQFTESENPYMENDDFQMTELLYGYWKPAGSSTMERILPASMLIVLPKRIDELANIEKSMTWSKLNQCMNQFMEAEVYVELPKFKIGKEIDLKPLMVQLGAGNQFDLSKANLSGIDTGPLFVSTAIHHAVIDINEEGTEAAADWMIAAAGGGAPKRAEFLCDHPFLFFILHRETNAVLFMGRVMNPAG